MAQSVQFTIRWQLKFIAMIVFTACLFIAKITVGRLMKSMALVADSFHMVSDFAALTVGYIALRFANSKTVKGKEYSQKFTFGWIRAEVLGGLINTVFLFALCFSIFISSLKRFVLPEKITNPKPVLIVGCISLFVNFIGLFLFRNNRDNICQCCFWEKKNRKVPEYISLMTVKGRNERNKCKKARSYRKAIGSRFDDLTWEKEFESPHSLNIRGVYLHILEHFLASFIVIVTALITMFVDADWVKYIDPGFTIMLVILILRSTFPLFRETLILFMQSVPANIKVREMKERLIQKVPAVLSVHEFHIWQLGGDQVVASAHILFKDTNDYDRNFNLVETFFRNEGIACMTFQPEFLPSEIENLDNVSINYMSNVCHYKCQDCAELTCCTHRDDENTESILRPLEHSSITSESEASIDNHLEG